MDRCDRHGWQDFVCEECAIEADVVERKNLRDQLTKLRASMVAKIRSLKRVHLEPGRSLVDAIADAIERDSE